MSVVCIGSLELAVPQVTLASGTVSFVQAFLTSPKMQIFLGVRGITISVSEKQLGVVRFSAALLGQ
jgi:hypothetical protein